ncbi:MAG: PD-(D/E)XK nuclease family protein [Pirellulales bacterium]
MPPIRRRNKFDPTSTEPFKLSRSKLELFLDCPRCFYLDRRLGVGRVSSPPYTLNAATDTLLKKEFDQHRAAGTPHPLMVEHGIDAVPFQHPDIDRWRHNFTGVQYLHGPTNLLVFGAVDDVWQTPNSELIVVDYKSTCTQKAITLDDPWRQAYKRQMEVYQWLLRQNGFDVSNTGYFVYVNADVGKDGFHQRMEFTPTLLSHTGSTGWIEAALVAALDCLAK